MSRLTNSQLQALSTLGCNYGSATEHTLWLDGLNRPRLTMLSLERRGLVLRGDYLNETDGYEWLSPLPLPIHPSWMALTREWVGEE